MMSALSTTMDDGRGTRWLVLFSLALNLFRGGGYVIHRTVTPDIGLMMLVSGPFIAVALWYSNHLHFRVNETLFRRVVAWMILVGGLSLFYRS